MNLQPKITMKRYLAVLVLVALLVGCEPPKSPSPAEKPSSPSPAPTAPVVQVRIADYAALQQLIAGHRGKVVVVDVWSTTCRPCREEFHHLVDLHKKYGPERIACVSLSLDYEGAKHETPEAHKPAVLKFLTEKGATFDNIIASEESQVMMDKHLRITNPPAVFVYDKTGQRHEKITPDLDAEDGPQAAGIYDRVEELVAEWIE